MSGASPQFEAAIAAIDGLNSQDPRQDPHDTEQPFELVYSKRMTSWLGKLEPDASDELRLAVRAQHITRWKIAREEYEPDGIGYKLWRSDLAVLHADTAAELLRDVGYNHESIARVRNLLLKKHLKTNPECQTLEDVACLVFLESYFAGFAEEQDDDKLIRILQQTWGKMSDAGHSAALALPLSPKLSDLFERALAG